MPKQNINAIVRPAIIPPEKPEPEGVLGNLSANTNVGIDDGTEVGFKVGLLVGWPVG
jgi:hypothetical protein